MRTKSCVTFIILFFFSFEKASHATTIVLQPNSTDGKDAVVANNTPDQNYATHPGLHALAWTLSSVSYVNRSFIQFDLSSIPVSSIIQQATLTLYNDPNGATSGAHSSLSGSNEGVLQRVLGSWAENTITWNNQPPTSAINEVIVPQSISPHQNYSLDVTAFVQDMINNPSSNFGWMLKVDTESYYRSLIFASSNNSNAALHPKLEITYSCLSIQPNSIDGIDAVVATNTPDQNYATHPGLHVLAWTLGSVSYVNRSFIQFDLSSIPVSSMVQQATLTLYNDPNGATSGAHSSLSGSNEGVLQRVLGSWAENTITWNNQPPTSAINEVIVPQSISPHQNYSLDVTAFVQDMINNPSSNFGWMLKVDTESYYRSLIFASSNNPDAALHPKLDICLSSVQYIHASDFESQHLFEFDPNPFHESFLVNYELKLASRVSFLFMDVLGRKIVEVQEGIVQAGKHNATFSSSVKDISPGMYILQMEVNGESVSGKIMKAFDLH